MTKKEIIETLEMAKIGNTKSKPSQKKQENQYKHWCFTLNNITDNDKIEIETILKKNCSKYIFEKEIGSKSNIEHFQGYFYLHSRRRLSELKKIFSPYPVHFEKSNNITASILYCEKDAKSDKDIYSKNIKTEKMLFYEKLNYAKNIFDYEFEFYYNKCEDEIIKENNHNICYNLEDVAFVLQKDLWKIEQDCFHRTLDKLLKESHNNEIIELFCLYYTKTNYINESN